MAVLVLVPHDDVEEEATVEAAGVEDLIEEEEEEMCQEKGRKSRVESSRGC